jgi:RNA polymerase sigma factor (sigma-70 family)
MTETELITQCIAGHRMAQRLLYERYSKAMYTVAYRLTSNPEDACEVVQDGFLQVFKHIGRFERRSTLGTWIKSIMVRTAISHLRRKRMETVEINEQSLPDLLDWGTSALDVEYLERAIAALPEHMRIVFVLAEVEGYSHQEIGDLLQIAVGTSKSRLNYAKTRLREMLTDRSVLS